MRVIPGESKMELKRVDSKVIKMYNTQTGYVEGDYTGIKGRFLDIWRNNFVCRLARVVGPRFLIITFCLYGLDQGGTSALNELGRVYSYKDRGYEPADTQRAIAYTDMSWYEILCVFTHTEIHTCACAAT